MSSWHPRKLPKIRDQIRNLLADKMGPFRRKFRGAVDRTIASLDVSELYWVTEDMAALAVAAGSSLEEISTTDRPAPAGLLIWEGGIGSVESDGYIYPVDAVSWGPHTDGVYVTAWLRRDGMEPVLREQGFLVGQDYYLDPLEVPPLLPYISTLVRHDGDLTEINTKLTTVISTLHATWLLMNQPRLVETPPVEVDKSIRRAYARTGRALPKVRLVELRRAYRPSEHNHEPTSRGRNIRWYVDGHWRNQACGPGWTQRDLIWIPLHIKGPDGAPILKREKVNVWKR